MKKYFKIFLFLLLFCVFTLQSVNAAEINSNNNPNSDVNIYFFYGDGCPHCSKEAKFLNKLIKDYPEINIKAYEVSNNRENANLMSNIAKNLEIEVSGVPLTIIGDKVFPGFYNEETTGEKIKSAALNYLEKGCNDIVASVTVPNNNVCEHGCDENKKECQHDCGCNADIIKNSQTDNEVTVPFFGKIDTTSISLPIFTIIIAAIDGFNPCAMWVLLFLISLLLNMQDRTKMWILGGTFIATSGIVYFFFLSAWLNLFLFIGFVFWIRAIIGSVALGSGAYHINEYIKNPKGVCHVSENENRKKIFTKLRGLVAKKNFWIALIGIIFLAISVNLIELVCSAGLPAVYTQVLALSEVPRWQYYGYLVLYIVIFMLDDLIIFFIAMTTLQMKGISSKYTHWANLIGGIIMILIGILLLFKPGWLMFG